MYGQELLKVLIDLPMPCYYGCLILSDHSANMRFYC